MFTVCRLTWKNTFKFRRSGRRQGDNNGINMKAGLRAIQRKLADLLAQHDTKATFFVLGWVAERHPRLVKALADQGHEIASHGYGHELVTTQTQEQFREDVRKAKRILEDLTGTPIIGYRAPSFSITAETSWALSTLVEEGHQYDSSIYDRFQRSYKAGLREGSYPIDTTAGRIWEVSPSTMNFAAFNFLSPVAAIFAFFPMLHLRHS